MVIDTTTKSWVRKRPREATPTEEVKRVDEKKYRERKDQAETQATKEHSSFKAGFSTSAVESN